MQCQQQPMCMSFLTHKRLGCCYALQEQRLRVADRITKRVLGNRPTQQRLLVAAAAAANGANGERTGMPRSGSNPSLMGLPAEVLEARRHELADLIRRNGEEFAQNVETVVEKVRGVCERGL